MLVRTIAPGCAGRFKGSPPLVVIHQIDVYRFAVVKSKDDPPIPRYPHTPKSAQIALERMQAKTWNVYVAGLVGVSKQGQDLANALGVRWIQPTWIVVIVETS